MVSGDHNLPLAADLEASDELRIMGAIPTIGNLCGKGAKGLHPQEDVKQVLDWLEKHGEVFLRKNVGIGRNLQKSRAYQKSHETFEGVVQVGEPFSIYILQYMAIYCFHVVFALNSHNN